jgi:Uma2 family endonuclease
MCSDASLVRLDRWQALTPEQRPGFSPLCPDLVVELVTTSAETLMGLSAVCRKMAAYQANGAQLGWLLIPHEWAVEVLPATLEPQRLEKIKVLEASPKFPALQLS